MTSSENNFFQDKVAKRLLLANVKTAFVTSACNSQIKYSVMRDNMKCSNLPRMEVQGHKPLDNAYFYLLDIESQSVMRCGNASHMHHTIFSISRSILTIVSMATSGLRT